MTMASRSGEMQALESDTPEGLLGGMSLPLGMTRRGLSYDDALEAPMSPPPPDINVNILWKRPVIPERKFQRLAEEDEPGGSVTQASCSDSAASGVASQPPVVKAKASSIIMNSLMTKQTQESIQRFEMQAGLTDAGYTPHKGLAAEEARYHRMAESLHKLKIQESKEERQTCSAQSTPNTTPQSSPKPKRRGWFSQGSIPAEFASTNPTAVGSGGSEGGAVDRWSAFGPRPAVHKSTTDPGGFALQAYRGAQKPTPMEVMKAQATRLAEDPANLQPPKLDIPGMEARRQPPRSHNLKPRDLNVLTPSGF